MRDIKFRSWDKKRNEWYGASQEGNGEKLYYGIHLLGEIMYLQPPSVMHTIDIITSQYTGLKDSEGKDIYEGDIVDFTYWWFDGNVAESHLIGTIVYSDHSMSFQLKGIKNKEWESFTGYENDSEYLTPFSELNFDDADFEIIGNIYENSELLGDLL